MPFDTHPLDVLVVLAFLAACLVIGIVIAIRMRGRPFDEFATDKGQLGLFHTTATVISTIAGFAIVFAHSIYGFQYGVSVFWAPPAVFIAFTLFGCFAPRLWREANQHNYTTYADMLLQRYDRKTQIIGSLLTLANFLSLTAINIFGIGLILSSLLGWTFAMAVVFAAGIVIIYTLLGGFRAVVWTDALQLFVTAIGLAILLPFAHRAVNAVGGMRSSLPQEYFALGHWGIDKIVGTYIVIIPVFFSSQDIWQRVFAAKDPKTAQRAVWIGGVIVAVAAACAVYLGMIARVLVPDSEPQLALPDLVRAVAKPGLAGLMLAAYLASFCSSADSFLLVVSSAITQDFYRRRNITNISDRALRAAIRWTTVVCGVLCIAIILVFPDIVGVLFTVLTWLMILVPATLAGFFWQRASSTAAFYSILFGFLTAVVYSFTTGDAETAGVVAIGPTLLILIIGSYWRPRTDTEARDQQSC